MANLNVVVFWTSKDENYHTWLWSELTRGRLRQGWGMPRTSLLEGGLPVPERIWVDRFREDVKRYWNKAPDEIDAEQRYRILLRMTDLQAGDVVIVPQMPRQTEFSMARVRRGYRFENPPDGRFFDDFGHLIEIDPESLRVFGYGDSKQTVYISSLFRRYRSAVNRVRQPAYIAAVQHIVQRGSGG